MPQFKVRIGCVVMAVVMSAVTYYLVEPKLRWGRFGGFKASGLLSAMVIIGVTGYSIDRHEGYTARMNDPDQTVIDAISKRMKEDNLRCLKEIPEWKKSWKRYITQCHFQRPSGRNNIAVIGDSYAGHLYPGLALKSKDDEGIVMFPTQCAIPLIGLQTKGKWGHTEHLLSKGFDYILSHENIKKVVLSNSPNCSWHNVIDLLNPDNRDFNAILRDGFIRTYEALTKAGKEVYVVSRTSPTWLNWQKCQSKIVKRPIRIPNFLSLGNASVCSQDRSDLFGQEAIDNWQKISRETALGYKNVHFVDLEKSFCSHRTCSMLDEEGNMLFMDQGHVNIKGSIRIASFIFNELRK